MGDKSFSIFIGFLCLAIICGTIITINTNSYKKLLQSKAGIILRYEIYKGCKVPIKADGRGGEYRWIGDVPWGKFTIEEKCTIAFSNGGILNDDDVNEIRQKYGSGRRR